MNEDKLKRFFTRFLILIFIALSLGQFSVIYKFGQGSVYLFDILILVFNILGLLFLLKRRVQRIFPLSLLPLVSFSLIGGCALLLTPLNLEFSEFAVSISYLLRFVNYITFGAAISSFIRNGFISRCLIFILLSGTGLFLFFAGLVQLTVLPDLETLDPSLGWDPHKFRMSSTFFDPNFLGMYFVLCLGASLKLLGLYRNHKKTIYIIIGILALGILLTFSRSAWLAAAILVFFYGLRYKAILIASFLVVFLAIFAVPRVQTRISGITDPSDSASFRLISWQNSWEIIKDNWLTGIGYNAFRYAQREYGFLDDNNIDVRSGAGSDWSLLLVWATSGIIGLLFFVSAFAVIALKALKKKDLIILGVTTALIIDSIFINSVFYPQILIGILIFATDEPARDLASQ